jgi:hypothetical protein
MPANLEKWFCRCSAPTALAIVVGLYATTMSRLRRWIGGRPWIGGRQYVFVIFNLFNYSFFPNILAKKATITKTYGLTPLTTHHMMDRTMIIDS